LTDRHGGELHIRRPEAPAASALARWRADLALVAAAFLFGSTFVIVQDAVEDAAPVPFLGVRFLIGAALLAVAARRRPAAEGRRLLVQDGVAAGVALAAGYLLQTVGLQYTSSSTSAFITYLLVVFVPVVAAVALRRPPQLTTVGGIAIAVAGLALLTGGAGGGFGRGEALTLGCALAFAVHIVIVSGVARRHDVLRFTFVQVAVVAVLFLVPGVWLGGYDFPASAWAAAAFTGTFATAAAFVFQIRAQQVVGPSRTAVLLLLEPVFAAVLGYLAGDRLGWRGLAGAGLIIVAILVTEVLPLALTSRSSSREPSPDTRSVR
jgi:drug/metabolite transporter (DMT)-like permease